MNQGVDHHSADRNISVARTTASAARRKFIDTVQGLSVGDVLIPLREGAMPAYVAEKKGAGKLPAVIVLPEIWGLHEHIREVTRRFANAGYYAIAPEPYHRQGDLTKITDVKTVLSKANELQDEDMFSDLDALLAWIHVQRKIDTNRLGLTGFSRGARAVWMYAAHTNKFKAAVAWYGGLAPTPYWPGQHRTPIDVIDRLDTPVLGLYGSADANIPLEQIERMRAALNVAGKNHRSMIHVYAGASHGFNADYRSSYHKKAAKDGWHRMLLWFRVNGVG